MTVLRSQKSLWNVFFLLMFPLRKCIVILLWTNCIICESCNLAAQEDIKKTCKQKETAETDVLRLSAHERVRGLVHTRSCQRVTGYSKCLTCALCQQFWFTGRRMEHGSEPRHNVIGENHPASSPLILQESNELKKTSQRFYPITGETLKQNEGSMPDTKKILIWAALECQEHENVLRNVFWCCLKEFCRTWFLFAT